MKFSPPPDDTNLNGKHGPTMSQEMSSDHQGAFYFITFNGKPLIVTRGGGVIVNINVIFDLTLMDPLKPNHWPLRDPRLKIPGLEAKNCLVFSTHLHYYWILAKCLLVVSAASTLCLSSDAVALLFGSFCNPATIRSRIRGWILGGISCNGGGSFAICKQKKISMFHFLSNEHNKWQLWMLSEYGAYL